MINEKFCEKLNEALANEHKAPIDYAELNKLAPSKREKKIIDGISSQEKNHFKKLTEIKKRLCS
ncbi:MAG: ferritin-like domain-containing protein [Spirochaetota bacterium]